MELRKQGGMTEGVENHHKYDKSRHSSVAGYPHTQKKIKELKMVASVTDTWEKSWGTFCFFVICLGEISDCLKWT